MLLSVGAGLVNQNQGNSEEEEIDEKVDEKAEEELEEEMGECCYRSVQV